MSEQGEKVTISDLHELDIDDLLGREPVAPKMPWKANISGKDTGGAGGSIEGICRQVITLGPRVYYWNRMNTVYSVHQSSKKKMFL